jgi:hypothetical protein
MQRRCAMLPGSAQLGKRIFCKRYQLCWRDEPCKTFSEKAMKKNLAIIFMLLSWPVSVIDRTLNSHPIDERYFYPLAPYVKNDIQWYVKDISGCIAYIFIFSALLLTAKIPPRITIIFKALFLIQLIDLIHYLLWYRHSEVILAAEGVVMLYATVKLFYNGNQHGKTA